ncbi:MAG: restriction endonuclease, partial [Anaerolineae bacterium]|nr:restriction endonuclease [Anaerolineae bacterium]
MTTIAHIRNMLLEEAILSLIRAGGYRPVDLEDETDPTLERGVEGVGVVGRGGAHCFEAIAEARYLLPGNRPQRLLIEAKTYASGKPVDVAVVQQAVGLVIDVNQARVWSGDHALPERWYAYRYVLCSTTGFSPEAQRYAFAQNIHLLQLDGLPQLAP